MSNSELIQPKEEYSEIIELIDAQRQQAQKLEELQEDGYGLDSPLTPESNTLKDGEGIGSKLQFDSPFSTPKISLKITHDALTRPDVINVLSIFPEIDLANLREAISIGESYLFTGNIGEYTPGSPLKISKRLSRGQEEARKQLEAIDKTFPPEEGGEKPSSWIKDITKKMVGENRNTLQRIEGVKRFVDQSIANIDSKSKTIDNPEPKVSAESRFTEKACINSRENRDRALKKDMCELFQMANCGDGFQVDIFGDNSLVVSSGDILDKTFWTDRFDQIKDMVRQRTVLRRNTSNFEAEETKGGNGGKPLKQDNSEASRFYQEYISDPDTTGPRLTHWSLGIKGHALYESGSGSAANSEATLTIELGSEVSTQRTIFFEADTGSPDYDGKSYQEGHGGMNVEDAATVFTLRHMRLLAYSKVSGEPDYSASYGLGYIEAQIIGKLDEKSDNISISVSRGGS